MPTSRTLWITAFLLCVAGFTAAQINDCADAVVLCSSENIAFNPQGPGLDDYADPDNDPGCIVALEQNSAWYYFEINDNAPPNLELGFIISPNGGFGEDYDWALYGPDVNCGDLGSPIRCSSSSAQCGFCPETGMGMGAMDVTEGPGTGDGFVMTLIVQPGQGFYLMIDNWLGTNNGFVLTWTGSAAQWLDCNATPPCALSSLAGEDISACEGETGIMLNGSASGEHGSETYTWTGTNGGTSFLSDPNSPNPTVDLPPGFSGTIIYTLVVEEDTCMGQDDVELIVNPLPVVQINPIGPFCANDPPQTLTGTPSGGIWGGAAMGNSFNPVSLGPGFHTVTYTYTDNNGCSNMAEMDVEVFDLPEVSILPDPADFCDSENGVLLTATGSGGAGGYTYAWNTPTGMGSDNFYDATLSGLHTVTVTDDNGCSNSTATTVTSYPNPTVEIIDPGPICGSTEVMTLSATPPGGEWDGTVVDPSGELYPIMIAPGSYSVSYTYIDANGCDGTDFHTITIIPVPNAFPENSGPVCEGQPFTLMGDTDGTGTVITYAWTGPNGYMSTEQNPSNATEGGTYILEVTVDGCPSLPATTIVNVFDAPDATAGNTGPYCNGEPIQLTGGTTASGPGISFSWTGPGGYVSDQQNPTDATLPGVYTLIIAQGGCPSLPSETEVIFSTPPDAQAMNTGPYCSGEAILLSGSTTASGNVITYSWSGPNGYMSNVQDPLDATASGQYQLIINVDGCSSLPATTDVVVNPAPQPVITGQDTFCTGFNTLLDAGPGYAAYSWSDASQGQTLTAMASGTYGVTVTDINGCTGTADITVTELTALAPVISGSLSFCQGSSTTLDAGPGYIGYAWSTGASTQSISLNTGGVVSVTVTDAQGCTGTAVATVQANPLPTVTITGSTTYCIGGFTVLNAGAGYATYLWSNDSTTQQLMVSSAGLYTVQVVDLNGCTGTASVMVDESTSLSPVITGSPAFCSGGSTTLDAGAGFATYAWSNGSSGQSINIDIAAAYTVTVSDGQGCSGTATVNVSEVMPPSASVQTDVSLCNTVAGGSVLDLYGLILSGDMSGTWNDADNSGASGPFTALDFDQVTPGLYRFVSTTGSAQPPCMETSYTVQVTVLDCACPDVSFDMAGPLCNLGDMLDLATILNSTAVGTWSLAGVPAGTTPANLVGTLFDATGGDAGAYTLLYSLSVTPPPGCPADYQLVIQVDDAAHAGIAAAPARFCADRVDVVDLQSLVMNADPQGTWTESSSSPSTGGAFDPTAGTFAIAGQAPGTYTFRYALPASGNCPGDSTDVTVVIDPLPDAVIAIPGILDCANPMLRLDATGSSSGPGFSIAWTGPGLVIDGNESSLMPSVEQAGLYRLTITNTATGCTSTATVTVQAMTDPPSGALIDASDVSCFGEVDAIIEVLAVQGGTAPYRYGLDGGPLTTVPDFGGLPAGSYALVVEDANGCRWDTTIVLVEPPAISIDLGPDITLGFGESGVVEALTNLAIAQVDTLLWVPANIIECLGIPCLEVSVQPAGSVLLRATIIDENGCEASDEILIEVDKTRRVYIPDVFSPNGDGINDRFFISGDAGQITEVRRFAILSRWGELLYTASGFQPNDPLTGWDGTYRNESVNPGVFVYVAEIEFIDGVVLTYTGDVTLLR